MRSSARRSPEHAVPRAPARRVPVLLVALALALALAPRPAAAADILNGITRVPPFDWEYHQVVGFSPPSGYGWAYGDAIGVPSVGRASAMLDCYVQSDWPWPGFRHTYLAYASLGNVGFHCTRTGSFTFETDVLLDGFAGIRVPKGPDFWGGAEAWLKVSLVMIVNDITWAPLPPTQVASRTIVLYDRFSQHTTEAPVSWNDQVVHYSLGPFTLQDGSNLINGPNYEAIVQLRFDGRIAGTGGNDGGYIRASFWPAFGTWHGYTYNTTGAWVQRMVVRDNNPDLAPPTTSLASGSLPPGTPFCGSSVTVRLTASDAPGGFGMGTTYYQRPGGAPQVYTGPFEITNALTHHYWSVDRAGNEELPHKTLWYGIVPPPAAPALVSVPDGSGSHHHPIDLSWRAVAGCDRYRLEVDDDPGFGSPMASLECTDTTSCLTDCQPATTYFWRVRAHQAQCDRWSAWSAPWSFTTDVVVGVPPAGLPVAFALRPNQPNPFAGSTTLRFDLPRAARVELDVFDAAGARVARLEGGVLPPGAHARTWHGMDDHGRRVGAGLYFVRMRAADFSATRRMILIR